MRWELDEGFHSESYNIYINDDVGANYTGWVTRCRNGGGWKVHSGTKSWDSKEKALRFFTMEEAKDYVVARLVLDRMNR